MFENYVRLTTCNATAVRYAIALEAFFTRFPDKTKAEEFTRRDVEDYRIYRLRDKLNPRTVNYEITVVRQFFKWMMDMDRAAWNPADNVKRLREHEGTRQTFTPAEQAQMWKGCFEWGDRALVGLVFTTGLRGDTLAQLTKDEVDFSGERLLIPPEKMKAGRNHEIPLPPWVLKILLAAPDGRLFEGYARNVAGLRYRWHRICSRAGLMPRGLHAARRAFATALLRSGRADIKMVSDLLGHKNIATTSRYITPADSDTVRQLVNLIPEPEGL